jgi:L-alanine-DL-glutamate epimerase-like enolase superfamily enzyme
MKIVDVQAIPLIKKLELPFYGGTYKIANRCTIVTRLTTSNGIVGETYGGDEDTRQEQVVDLINGPFRKLLLGREVMEYEKLWRELFDAGNRIDLGNRGLHSLDMANHAIIMQALSAVDIAIWDTIGKSLNAPVYDLLGGTRTEVPVIGIGGYHRQGKSLEELVEEIVSIKREGLAGVKLKVGTATVEEDLARVSTVRQKVGEGFEIACDANQAWNVPDAISFGRGVNDLNICWLEEPVAWYDQFLGLKLVRETTGIAVAAGQGEISKFGCRDLIRKESVDVLNCDVTLVGGVTEWRKVAAMAEAFHISMAHHEEPQIALHLLSGIPNGRFVEIFPDPNRDPLWRELNDDPPPLIEGKMRVSKKPGFGLKLSERVIEKYGARL